MENTQTLRRCLDLVEEFGQRNEKDAASRLHFYGAGENKDVYNITAPFEDGGAQYIAGRVESRDSEYSQVVFFKGSGYEWTADDALPRLDLQDPFVCRIDGQLNYRTVFYKGEHLAGLQRFTHGPDRMKDIRLHQLADGRVLVMTRPQGAVGGRGKIGWIILDDLSQLDIAHIEQATILEQQFLPEEWGGANELHALGGSKVGVLAHIARYDEKGDRHYHSAAFVFDWSTGEYSPMKIIAMRCNFQDGPSKRPDLEDVIFSGGLVRLEGGKARLYCGVSDAEGHMITIDDPFQTV